MNLERVEPIDILLVEDNLGDVRLTSEALRSSKIANLLHVVNDGDEALAYLQKTGRFATASTPHLIILDLNLPRTDGREVLEQVKTDKNLKHIPVVVMTSSEAEEDVLASYSLYANCYVTKPISMDSFKKVVSTIDDFWFSVVRLPGADSES